MTSGLPFTHDSASTGVASGLAPVVGMVFLGFLSVGVPLAALAIELRDHGGHGPAAIGGVIGLQALATLLTRHAAGTLCATRAVPAGMRGRAVGNFIAFADIAMGVTGPTAGLVVQWSGVPSAFLIGAAATVLAPCLLPSLRPARTA